MQMHYVERLEREDSSGPVHEIRLAKALELARRSYVDGLKGTARQRVLRIMREPALARAVELYGKRRHLRSLRRARALLARGRRA